MKKAILVAAMLALGPMAALSQTAPRAGAPATSPPAAGSSTVGDAETAGGPEQRGAGRDLLDRLSQSELKEHIASAVHAVQDACASDIQNFCSQITPGEGRMLLCMRVHENELSRRCLFSLYQASRNLERAVEIIADTCFSNIQAQCGNAEKIGQCAMQKSASLSPACRTIVAALSPGVSALMGLPVYSSDDRALGQVIDVVRGPGGQIQSVQVETGRALGLGSKVVTINADNFEQMRDRIKTRFGADDVRSMPETKRQ